MRFTLPAALALVALAATDAVAGRIFGDIKIDGKPVGVGVLVTLQPVSKAAADKKAESAPIDTTQTDKVGSYKFMVKEEGKYKLTVLYDKQSVPIEVFSSKEPTRYDLILAKKDGKLELRRK
jgi:hypothetical protein